LKLTNPVLRIRPEETIVVFRAEDGAGSVQYPGFGKTTDLNKETMGSHE
jgi:hypothetical protein